MKHLSRKSSQKRSHLRSPSGFALPSVLAVGLILVLISMTIILRTLSDRQIANVQGFTYQSLLTTETGLTRVQDLLIKYPGLAAKDGLRNWSTEAAKQVPAPTCGTPPGSAPAIVVSPDDEQLINAIQAQQWINLEPNNPSQGQFQASSYTVQDKISQLAVQGQFGLPGRTAKTAIEVQMPLTYTAPPAGIWVTASTQTPQDKEPIIVEKNRSLAANVFVEDLRGDFNLRTYDPRKMGCQKFQEGICKTYQFSKSTNPKPAPPAIPEGSLAARAQKLTINDLNALFNAPNAVLPRPQDKPDADNNYRYLIEDVLSLKETDKLTISPPGKQKVILYLASGMTVGGQLNSDGKPENLEIYGSSSQQKYGTKAATTLSLLFTSRSPLKAFIYAPDAKAEIQGDANLVGALWVKQLVVSAISVSNNNALVTQSNCFQNLEVGTPNPIGVQTANIQPPKTWQRKSVKSS